MGAGGGGWGAAMSPGKSSAFLSERSGNRGGERAVILSHLTGGPHTPSSAATWTQDVARRSSATLSPLGSISRPEILRFRRAYGRGPFLARRIPPAH